MRVLIDGRPTIECRLRGWVELSPVTVGALVVWDQSLLLFPVSDTELAHKVLDIARVILGFLRMVTLHSECKAETYLVEVDLLSLIKDVKFGELRQIRVVLVE